MKHGMIGYGFSYVSHVFYQSDKLDQPLRQPPADHRNPPLRLGVQLNLKKMATESKDVEVNVGKTMPFLPAIWEW